MLIEKAASVLCKAIRSKEVVFYFPGVNRKMTVTFQSYIEPFPFTGINQSKHEAYPINNVVLRLSSLLSDIPFQCSILFFFFRPVRK